MRLGEMKRRRSGEEDRLFHYEIVQFGDNFIVECCHCRGPWEQLGNKTQLLVLLQRDNWNTKITLLNK